MKNQGDYDKRDINEIIYKAKKLLNKSLRDLYGDELNQQRGGKGAIGQMVEKYHFKLKINSNPAPDFEEAGIELKTVPLKKVKGNLVSKERLVLNIIDYNKEHTSSFENSSFYRKNKKLLLMFYLHLPDQESIDHVFRIVGLWEFPENDLKIIKDDWLKIVHKIKKGLAHELSESDTFYLGACTKGANRNQKRDQPFSEERAMQRAFSLKQKYVNHIIISLSEKNIETELIVSDKVMEYEPILKKVDHVSRKIHFEDLILEKFRPFIGFSELELRSHFNLDHIKSAKNRYYLIAKSILGISAKKIEEFEKADIKIKTIRMEKDGSIRESMSFRQIKFLEIVNQSWEESDFYEDVSRRFFFVIFRMNERNKYILTKVRFLSIPNSELDKLKEMWTLAKESIEEGDFEKLPKESDNLLGHVRPKGLNREDKMEAPDGSMQGKKCFWLNRGYVKELVNRNDS